MKVSLERVLKCRKTESRHRGLSVEPLIDNFIDHQLDGGHEHGLKHVYVPFVVKIRAKVVSREYLRAGDHFLVARVNHGFDNLADSLANDPDEKIHVLSLRVLMNRAKVLS